jgi:Protein of unknown function (DUF3175)
MKTTRRSASRRKRAKRSAAGSMPRRWSARVTRTSNALDLEPGVFSKPSARQVALSLKRSAERSRRRKSEPFRSAMSMLNLYINRAGKNLSPARRRILHQAKTEVRRLFKRSESGKSERKQRG